MKLPKTFFIETERCRLRIVSREDIPYVFSATRFSGFNDGMLWEPPETIEELKVTYQKNILRWEEGSVYSFTIEDKNNAAFIGRIGLYSEMEADIWSVGFWTHPDKQNLGFASEALKAIVDLAFSQLGALRVDGCHALWNIASKRVLEKAGMTFVRHIPEGFKKDGKWVSENLLSVHKNQCMK